MKNKIFIASFLLIIFSLGILTFITPDKKISAVEKRELAQLPNVTKDNILNGEFLTNFQDYFNDQFFSRDFLIKVYTKGQLILNKTMINNIVITEDNWLLGEPIEENKNEIDLGLDNLQKFSNFLEKNQVEAYFALAPNSMNLFSNKYPDYLKENKGIENRSYFLSEFPTNMHLIDLPDYFANHYSNAELESFYYRTDHHWNMKGAFIGYQEIMNQIGKASIYFRDQAKNAEEVFIECNNEAVFVGSRNIQLYELIDASGEEVCRYLPNNIGLSEFSATDRNGKTLTNFNIVFGSGVNNKEVSYTDLFSYDYPEIKFSFENTNNNRLLILKDSYANPIIPLIASHFSETFVLDIRHYTGDISKYVSSNGTDIVLILYNDTNLSGEMYNFIKD